MGWADAKSACESNGMKMIEPRTTEKVHIAARSRRVLGAISESDPGAPSAWQASALAAKATRDYAWIGLKCPSETVACNGNLDLWEWLRDGPMTEHTYTRNYIRRVRTYTRSPRRGARGACRAP